jgi:uncharacterized protein YtpQ (UPF0354 family)
MDDTEGTIAAPSIALSAEHSWEAARQLLYPVLRPAGSAGLRLDRLTNPALGAGRTHPLIDDGPLDLVVAYALVAAGFDVLATSDHLAAWGVTPAALREAAYRNLAAWSGGAPWSEDADERRRVISSDTGDGWDASRILLPEVRSHLESELGGAGSRVLVGLPARHLLLAGALRPEDPEFAPLFVDFVLEYAGDSDEAIDRRVFELRQGRLILFAPASSA